MSENPIRALLEQRVGEKNDLPFIPCPVEIPVTYPPAVRRNDTITSANTGNPIRDLLNQRCGESLEEEDDDEPITLSIRQPSFSNLHGQMIPKGSTKPILPEVSENVVSARLYSSQNVLDVQNDLEEEIMDEEEEKPITLSVRQPSFSNLRGTLIPKGVPKNSLPILEENNEKSNQTTESKASDDIVLNLNKLNASRWKSIGYIPPVPFVAKGLSKKGESATLSTSNFYPKIVELQIPDINQSNNVHSSRESKVNNESVPDEPVSPDPASSGNCLSPSFFLNLEKPLQQQGYDSEQGSSRIPAKLYGMIKHPREHLVYLALCGVSIAGYEKSAYNEAMTAIKQYLNQCIKENMIEEAAYIKSIIDKLKKDHAELQKFLSLESVEEIQHKLDNAEKELDITKVNWDRKRNILDADCEIALENAKLKHNESVERLNIEWQSPSCISRYNHPSHKLIALRQQAKKFMSNHMFNEAAIIANQIASLEKGEIAKATSRMQKDFQNELAKLDDQYHKDIQSIRQQFLTKINDFETSKERSFLPVENRITKIINQKKGVDRVLKKTTVEMKAKKADLNTKAIKLKNPNVLNHNRLLLTPLSTMKRAAHFRKSI